MAASDNFFQKAELAVKKRNYEYAITLYQQGLAIDPDRLEERKNLRGCQVRFVQEKGGSTVGGGMFKIKNAKTIGVIAKLGKQKKFEEQIVEIEKLLTLAPSTRRPSSPRRRRSSPPTARRALRPASAGSSRSTPRTPMRGSPSRASSRRRETSRRRSSAGSASRAWLPTTPRRARRSGTSPPR